MVEDIIEERARVWSSLRGGVLKLMLLRSVSRGSDYPYAMLKALKCHTHMPFGTVTKNEVYNALSALEKQGYVRSRTVLSGGKAQRHYRLTAKGAGVVRRSRHIILQLIKSMKLLVSEFDKGM